MDEARLIRAALDCGASAADVVTRDGIATDPSFRALCEENRCGLYGRCYMCPPDIGPVEELIAQVLSFDRGLLYQTVSPLEDSFDIRRDGRSEDAAYPGLPAIAGRAKVPAR